MKVGTIGTEIIGTGDKEERAMSGKDAMDEANQVWSGLSSDAFQTAVEFGRMLATQRPDGWILPRAVELGQQTHSERTDKTVLAVHEFKLQSAGEMEAAARDVQDLLCKDRHGSRVADVLKRRRLELREAVARYVMGDDWFDEVVDDIRIKCTQRADRAEDLGASARGSTSCIGCRLTSG